MRDLSGIAKHGVDFAMTLKPKGEWYFFVATKKYPRKRSARELARPLARSNSTRNLCGTNNQHLYGTDSKRYSATALEARP